jgi:hypothetical protein
VLSLRANGSAARQRGFAARHCQALARRVGNCHARRSYEPVALPELLEPVPPMWVQWCVPGAPGIDPVWLDPAEADEDGDADALGAVEDDVVDALDVPALVAAPPVDANATPVKPAPSPAATTPVMMSRLARPSILETMRFLPSRWPAAGRGRLAFEGSACVAGLAGTGGPALSEP